MGWDRREGVNTLYIPYFLSKADLDRPDEVYLLHSIISRKVENNGGYPTPLNAGILQPIFRDHKTTTKMVVDEAIKKKTIWSDNWYLPGFKSRHFDLIPYLADDRRVSVDINPALMGRYRTGVFKSVTKKTKKRQKEFGYSKELLKQLDVSLKNFKCEMSEDAIRLRAKKKATIELNDKKNIDRQHKRDEVNRDRKKKGRDLYDELVPFTLEERREGIYKSHMSAYERLSNPTSLKVSRHGRIEHCFTNIPNYFWRNVTVQGDSIIQIDVANSQILFLCMLMEREGMIVNPKFKELACDGTIYENIDVTIDSGASQKQIYKKKKRALFKYLFSNNTDRYKLPAQIWLEDDFPKVDEFIRNYKEMWFDKYKREFGKNWHFKRPKPYARLATELQRMEADLMYNNVVMRLFEQVSSLNLICKHDSNFVAERYKDTVTATLREEFQKVGYGVHLAGE